MISEEFTPLSLDTMHLGETSWHQEDVARDSYLHRLNKRPERGMPGSYQLSSSPLWFSRTSGQDLSPSVNLLWKPLTSTPRCLLPWLLGDFKFSEVDNGN